MTSKKRQKPTNEKPRVVGYIRVSSSQQADSGLSLSAQREKITAYAALYGLDLVAIVEDAGVSAKRLERPGLTRALSMLDDGKADGLLITKLDRLSRSLKDWPRLVDRYFGDRAKTPSTLFSVGDSIDTTTAAGRLVLNVLVSVSQWEREVIGERTAAALAVKAKRGEATSGTAPLGLKLADDGVHLIHNDAEAVALARVLELRAQGLSVRAIVDALNAERLPCRGKRWHATSVDRIIKRQAA